jgi:hypothetical protein
MKGMRGADGMASNAVGSMGCESTPEINAGSARIGKPPFACGRQMAAKLQFFFAASSISSAK